MNRKPIGIIALSVALIPFAVSAQPSGSNTKTNDAATFARDQHNTGTGNTSGAQQMRDTEQQQQQQFAPPPQPSPSPSNDQ